MSLMILELTRAHEKERKILRPDRITELGTAQVAALDHYGFGFGRLARVIEFSVDELAACLVVEVEKEHALVVQRQHFQEMMFSSMFKFIEMGRLCWEPEDEPPPTKQ